MGQFREDAADRLGRKTRVSINDLLNSHPDRQRLQNQRHRDTGVPHAWRTAKMLWV